MLFQYPCPPGLGDGGGGTPRRITFPSQTPSHHAGIKYPVRVPPHSDRRYTIQTPSQGRLIGNLIRLRPCRRPLYRKFDRNIKKLGFSILGYYGSGNRLKTIVLSAPTQDKYSRALLKMLICRHPRNFFSKPSQTHPKTSSQHSQTHPKKSKKYRKSYPDTTKK